LSWFHFHASSACLSGNGNAAVATYKKISKKGRNHTMQELQQRILQDGDILPARERFVLELRYGLTDGRQHPQHEIARRLGISRSYVSRVEKKAVALLRDEIERE
jgi:RNA polymerase sigma factor (sigma-70 family)